MAGPCVFYFYVDPYLDRRTGYFFGINAAGSFSDGVMLNDNWQDNSWDGVWEGKVNINNEGWTAEIRIPFSQLRFQNKDKYEWGINFARYINRKHEYDYLVYVPKNESGFVSRFFTLEGIECIKPSGSVEVLPYVTSRAEYVHHSSDDPFNKNSKYVQGFGTDIKFQLGSNLTLNATINPDFGQVEADPAVVNLSAAETFYDERRSFFVEGSSIFNFGMGGINNNWTLNWQEPRFFYSRRIGRTPQGDLPDNDFNNYPSASHILGAAKLTGKVGDNINIGTIQSLTSREYADYQYSGVKSSKQVEPLTYYGIARAQKEFNEGKNGIGLLSTFTNRFFNDNGSLREQLPEKSLVTGLDGWLSLDKNREWVISGWGGISNVSGSSSSLINFQNRYQRYMQRPDSKQYRTDSLAKSLTGYAGRIQLNKQQGNAYFKTTFAVINPLFDVNDLGFMGRSDIINMSTGGGYFWSKPNSFFRNLDLGGGIWREYDFDYNKISEGLNAWGYIEFPNYYGLNCWLNYFNESMNNRRTRGGPLTLNPVEREGGVGIHSDSRKFISFYFNLYGDKSDELDVSNISFGIELKPLSNLKINLSPGINHTLNTAQWVDSYDDPAAGATYKRRYIFGKMDQLTYSAGIRVNWIFTPELSLQFYVRPLISTGRYNEFKELAKSGTFDFNTYGNNSSIIEKDGDDYIVDADGKGPANEYRFGNPDFNYKSIRGNAVLRWEYMPGSTLYLVWTQNKEDNEVREAFSFRNSFGKLIDARPDNIFMMKFTYWLNI
jgi:hypothetical protein